MSAALTESQAVGHGRAARIVWRRTLRLQEAVVQQVAGFLHGERGAATLRHAVLVHRTADEDQTPSGDREVARNGFQKEHDNQSAETAASTRARRFRTLFASTKHCK